MWKTILLAFMGISYGMLSAAGVFTVLVAIGLVPRFAGRTHTARKVFLYEEMVIFGTLFGCVLSVFERYCHVGGFLQGYFPAQTEIWTILAQAVQVIFGFFSGMFVGCLALAIAEMLDSIPIFARRISFRHGIGLVVLTMAAAKLCGSLFYFGNEFAKIE